MPEDKVAILHYSAPPVVGGVEAVILEHCRVLSNVGYKVSVIAGRGDVSAISPYAEFICLPEMDSQYKSVRYMAKDLENGLVPEEFESVANSIFNKLSQLLVEYDHVIVHNIFTKHFNLPLTVAINKLLTKRLVRNCIAWCHDFTWTSPASRSKVHPGYPWDLLRIYRQDIKYVVVSKQRQGELARLFNCPIDNIRVIYNGVDPRSLLGLSQEGDRLINRLSLLSADLVIIMPVRLTQAKNIELAIRMVAVLKEKLAKPKLVLTGPPDPHDDQIMTYYENLKSMRRALGVENEVRFVFESGSSSNEHYYIDYRTVGDLFRVSDIMFMPSHREGFGMPILEAGLVGTQVICTPVPAAEELGGVSVIRISTTDPPEAIAAEILEWMTLSSTYRLRKKVRQQYTWESIFANSIKPLLVE